MPVAAVPRYLGNDFSSASPGLRFGMYLKLWGMESRSKEHLWATHDVNYRRTGRNQEERQFKDENKTSALKCSAKFNEVDRQGMDALASRQQAVFRTLPESDGLTLIAESVAPFTTGLGNEHPLENGFAFLNPYGLPYLPGSGVKGVVRRAAEELAHRDFFEDDSGWTLPAVWCLFGFEHWPEPKDESERASWAEWIDGFLISPEEVEAYLNSVLDGSSESRTEMKKRILSAPNPLRALLCERQLHVRGALEFWDVIPQVPRGGNLHVEIMTPHQSHYYQPKEHAGSVSPHDSGQPTPISFLAVPPGSGFTFHVRCDRRRLSVSAPELAADDRWRELLQASFEHAFAWLGFGAKTAVGYGAMKRDRVAEKEAREQQEQENARREREEEERNLPEDAVWVRRRIASGEWNNPNDFLSDVEGFLDDRSSLSKEAHEQLSTECTNRWKGILDDPDAVKGKKRKPKYSPRPRALAKRLIAFSDM